MRENLQGTKIQTKENRVWPGWPTDAMSLLSVAVLLFGLSGSLQAGNNSCIKSYFEYRSCSGSRTWCGFDTFIPTTPPTKYRTRIQQDWATNYFLSASYPSAPYMSLSADGTVVYSGSGSGTNWGVWCYWRYSFQHSAGVITYNDSANITNDFQCSADVWAVPNPTAIAGIQFTPALLGSTPDLAGSITISCTEDCVWTTNSTGLFLCDLSLNGETNATVLNLINKAGYTPARRTYTLTNEYTRDAVESKILEDLAGCPTGAWSRKPVAAESSLSGSTVTLKKVGYRIKLPNAEPDAVYSLSWIVRYSFDDGSPAGASSETRVLVGTGFEVSTDEIILLPPLGVGGEAVVDESSLEVKVVGSTGGCCGDGTGSDGAGGFPGGGTLKLASAEATFDLGRANYGRSAAQLSLSEQELTTTSATPASLKFLGDTRFFEVITNSAGILQVRGA